MLRLMSAAVACADEVGPRLEMSESGVHELVHPNGLRERYVVATPTNATIAQPEAKVAVFPLCHQHGGFVFQEDFHVQRGWIVRAWRCLRYLWRHL